MADLVRRATSRLVQKLGSRSQHDSKAHTGGNSWKTRRFQFRSLDQTTQQIRLLRLLPKGSEAATDTIACEIKPFDIAEAPSFSALSWAWGNSYGIEENICINDSAFKVANPSLLDALKHLRRYFTHPTSPAEQDQDAAVGGIDIERLLNSEAIPGMQQTLARYLEAYEHTLFVTSNGVIGNGPRAMRTADQVVLFDDVQMPFVVRPLLSGHGCELVGSCYVQGISDGELAAVARRGEIKPVEIVLV